MILSQGNETSGESPTLTVRNLSKRFGDALVLKNVDLDIGRGEVHGLLGHNGSGKSTLIKILAGFHEPEPGAEITLNGQTVRHPISAADFTRLGLAFVHQNLGLIPSLSTDIAKGPAEPSAGPFSLRGCRVHRDKIDKN